MKNRATPIAIVLLVIVLGLAWVLTRSKQKPAEVAADSAAAPLVTTPRADKTQGAIYMPQAQASAAQADAPPTAPPPAQPTDQSTTVALTATEQQHLKVLDDVLKSRNDNDPRLDSDFRNLTPQMKSALRDKYASAPNENRNERGTVAFLLGREIKSSDDVGFLASILNEPACQSLQDCSQRPSVTPDEHAAMASEVTLVYPQLVAIKSLERFLAGASPDDPARKAAVDALTFAERSPQSKIASAAQQALAHNRL